MGTPQEMLDYIVQSSPSVSPCSIRNILKSVSDRLGEAPAQVHQTPQAMPRSRAAQPHMPFRMAEQLLTEIVDGYELFHNTGIHSVAFRSPNCCYAVISKLVGTDVKSKEFPDVNSREFRDTMVSYKMIIGKYMRGENCSSQDIAAVKKFCDTICRLAENYIPPEYEH